MQLLRYGKFVVRSGDPIVTTFKAAINFLGYEPVVANYAVQGLQRMWAEHSLVDLALTPAVVVKRKNLCLPLETKILMGDP